MFISGKRILPPPIQQRGSASCTVFHSARGAEVLVGGGAPPVDPDVVTKLPRAPPPGMNPDTVEAPKVGTTSRHHGGTMVMLYHIGMYRLYSDFGILENVDEI